MMASSKRSGSSLLPLFVLAMLALVFGFAMLSGGMDIPVEIRNASDLTAAELRSNAKYAVAFKNVIVCDEYAYTTEGDKTKSTEVALLVHLKDCDILISAREPNSGEFHDIVTAYINDDSQQIGDCVIDFVGTVSGLGTKFVEYLDSYYSTKLSMINDLSLTVRHNELTYHAATPEAYAEKAQRSHKNNMIFGVILLGIGIALTALGIGKRAEAERRAAANAAREQSQDEHGDLPQ